MADGSQVPVTIPAFDTYLGNTTTRLQAVNAATGNPYYADYGFTPAQNTAWNDRYKSWAQDLYPAYKNPATSTSIAKDKVHVFMKEFRGFASPLLKKIIASDVAGTEEEHIFNFVLHRKNPTHIETPIKLQCAATMHSLGRGEYEISCKAENEKGRSHKVDGSDSVQFAYAINAQTPATAPTPDDASMVKEIATSATFTHDFGSENQGKWLTIYFRWFNTKHPQLAGAWSAVQTVAVG